MPYSQESASGIKELCRKLLSVVVSRYFGALYLNTQWLRNAAATTAAVIILSGIATVSLENRSVITSTKRLCHAVRVRSPKISIATNSRGPEAENSCKNFCAL